MATRKRGGSGTKERRRSRARPLPLWHQHAGFSLFFDRSESDAEDWCTRIYHDESDKEVVLRGVARTAWSGWIARQAHLPDEREDASGRPSSGVELEVSDVTVSERVGGAGLTSLRAELRFKISGSMARDLVGRHTPYRVETYAVDLERGDSKLVASNEGELQESLFEYTTEQVFPVPHLGLYQLHNVVVLLPPEEAMAAHRGPVIEIVP